MMKRFAARLAASLMGAALVLGAAASAHASTLVFTLTGSPENTFSFTADSSPTPTTAFFNAVFTINAPGTFADGSHSAVVAFFSSGQSFQLGYNTGTSIGQFDAPTQLYTGPESSPTFKTGVFQLTNNTDSSIVTTLTIGEEGAPGAPGPEVGLGLIPAAAALAGLAMTRTRTRRRVA
jgi:hypothetical protein